MNVPVPEVVHVDEVAPPPRIAESKCVEPEQIVASLPAATVGIAFMVNIITSLAALQGPAGLSVVSVSETVPEVISAAEGVYSGVSDDASLNVPVPEVDHVDEMALPPRLPDNV